MCFATRCILARGYSCVKSSFESEPHGMPWGSKRHAVGRYNRAGGRLDSRRRTAAAVLGPLPPNRRRPGADPGPLAGFLSVRDLLRLPQHTTALVEGCIKDSVTEQRGIGSDKDDVECMILGDEGPHQTDLACHAAGYIDTVRA